MQVAKLILNKSEKQTNQDTTTATNDHDKYFYLYDT